MTKGFLMVSIGIIGIIISLIFLLIQLLKTEPKIRKTEAEATSIRLTETTKASTSAQPTETMILHTNQHDESRGIIPEKQSIKLQPIPQLATARPKQQTKHVTTEETMLMNNDETAILGNPSSSSAVEETEILHK
ncbi:hypothetical protein [Metabacillus malikii]|uniref:RND superfamily exporter protein n=1 Tax=Metabacillus malikii TaxID=1504265 RepID=A0ABT9ZGQ5_9BACI|nr:hypothetical protein [Metabacillus malikii]MDQ0231476.1 putative RND superfamily exporter protein [Metabacillus malikii]